MSSGLQRLERFVDARGECIRRSWSRSEVAAGLGIDPHREVAAQRLAAAAGIAPPVLEFDPAQRWMVMPWIEGEPLEFDWVLRSERRRAVADVLVRLRTLAPEGLPELDLIECGQRLYRTLHGCSARDAAAFTRPWQMTMQAAEAAGLKASDFKADDSANGRCLVHGDLTPANARVLSDGSLVLLDFEYAYCGSAYADLAGLLAASDPGSSLGSAMRAFVEECLRPLGEGVDSPRFTARVQLRRLVDQLWWAVVKLQTGNAEGA